MGLGSRRRYCDRPSVNAVSVGRRDDWTVWGRVLGIRKVDRPERVAVQREEDHAGTHVHGWRGVLPGKSVRPMGISVQECLGPRTDPVPVHRDNIYVSVLFPFPSFASNPSWPFGVWNMPFWAFVCTIILYAAAMLPTPTFVQPTNSLAFYPAYAAIVLLLVGALATPFTNIPVSMPAGPFLFDPQGILGPIWPILFVAIACGALPVGGGAMLSEGLLALVSLIAYMVLLPADFVGRNNVGAWVFGAVKLTTPFLGGLTVPVLTTFFGLVLIIYALTVQALVTRFFRLVAAETWSEGRFHVFGNKQVATAAGLGIPWGFAVSGSWWALWLYFGGANQLLAGLAIMLITIHLAKVRAPTRYSLVPGIFMIVTTLAALAWQTYTFANSR